MKTFTIFFLLLCVGTSASAFQLKFIGAVDIATGAAYGGTEIGGLSGITYDNKHDEFLCISDSRTDSHFFHFKANFSNGSFSMTPTEVTFLLDANGIPFPEDRIDAEGIALSQAGEVYLSLEGNGKVSPRIPSAVMKFGADGRLQSNLPLPDVFLPDALDPQEKGTPSNRGLESLSITPDNKFLFTSSEDGLIQDDTPSGFDKGSMARLLRVDLQTQKSQQYGYYVAAVPRPAGQVFKKAMSALSDIIALDASHLLALEKSVSKVDDKERVKIQIYLISTEGATEISGIPSLKGIAVTPVQKTLVLDFDDFMDVLAPHSRNLENMEGMTFGPTVNGHRTLIVVADNNFSSDQKTQFIAFEVGE